MADHTPPASSYFWNITSGGTSQKQYELALFANQIFGKEVGFKTVYREVGQAEWLWLIEPSIFESDDFDTKTAEIYEHISSKVKTFFLLDDSAPPIPPETLFEQCEQLIRFNTKWNVSTNTLEIIK